MRLKVGSHEWYVSLTHTYSRTRNMTVIWYTHFSPFPRKSQEQRKENKFVRNILHNLKRNGSYCRILYSSHGELGIDSLGIR